MLEEEAFPFEEKSIHVHEKNLELMATGIYNPWIEKSLDRLAQLMPGRYAKPEESTGPLASLETYTYRSPALALAPSTAPTEATVPNTDTPLDSTPASETDLQAMSGAEEPAASEIPAATAPPETQSAPADDAPASPDPSAEIDLQANSEETAPILLELSPAPIVQEESNDAAN
jgi:hypothetical protein